MSKSNDTDNFVYNANGVPFKIWRARKRTRRCDEGKFYWLLEDYSTGKRRILNRKTRKAGCAVSYTHLTLPTKRIV